MSEAVDLRSLKGYVSARPLLVIGALVFIYALTSIVWQAYLPSDGVLLAELRPSGVRVTTRLDTVGTRLLIGDQIMAINDRSIWEWAEETWRGQHSPQWQIGQNLVYRVRRDGVPIDVPVTLRAFPIERLPLARFGVYILLLTGIVISSFILIRRPDVLVVQLFFMMSMCSFVTLVLHFQTTALMTPWLLIGESLLRFTARVFLYATTLHLALIFPVVKIKSPIWQRRLRWLYWSIPLISVPLGLLLGGTPLQRFVLASQISGWLGMVMLVCSILCLAHTYVTVRDPAVRGQIRWVAWGSVVGAVPYIVYTGLPEVLLGRAILSIEFTAFFLVALPVTMAIAVARYRLIDIDLVMWRTLLYAVYGMVAIAVYLVIKGVARQWVSLLAGHPGDAFVVFVATALTVSGFWVLRVPVTSMAERWLFRTPVHPQAMLKQVTEQITGAIRLDQLSLLMTETLPRQMGAVRGELLILDENDDSPPSPDQALSRLMGPALAAWLAHDGEPIVRSALPVWASPDIGALLSEHEIEVAIPLRVGDRIVGVWGVGPRAGRLSYTTADVRIAETVARQAALAVSNAQLVQRMQRHQQQLEDEVHRRTQVMENDRNRLNAIVQNMADALLVTDARERIQLTNPAFENLVRRSHRSLLGHDLADVVPLPRLSEAIKQALAVPGTIHNADITLVMPALAATSDAVMAERVLKISVTALGDKSAVICVLRDVTYEVEVDRMKSGFISSISHELRTPVTAILGFAKLTSHAFERSIRPALPTDDSVRVMADRIHQNLDIMVTEGENLTTLINDILDIAALDAGTIVWSDRSYDFSLMVQDVVERLRESAEAKGLLIETRISRTLPVLCVDPARIEQVLSHLISNAIKFTDKGMVAVTAEGLSPGDTIHEWRVPDGGGVVVSVRDTGPGIPRQDIANIFQRFWQGEDPARGKPAGAGLGLAISRDIVVHYGGDIWVESTSGIGSTFHFTLPAGDTGNRSVSNSL